MKPLRFSVALQLFVVFASGILVGGLAYRVYTARSGAPPMMMGPPMGRGGGPSFRDRWVNEMRERLELRDDQVRRLTEILEFTGRGFRDSKRRYDVDIKMLQDRQQTQIRQMLDSRQRTEYEKMLQEREEQMRRDRGQRRGGRGRNPNFEGPPLPPSR